MLGPIHIFCVVGTGSLICFIVFMRAFAADKYPMTKQVQQPPTTSPSFQLFLPNALISLTEDNSTFFPARPAAFGPKLLDEGLSAILWIGAGFGEDGIEPQGELGCSDVPGWDSHRAADGVPFLPENAYPDDGTDNYLEDLSTGVYFRSPRRVMRTKPAGSAAPPAAAVAAVAAAAAADGNAAGDVGGDAAAASKHAATVAAAAGAGADADGGGGAAAAAAGDRTIVDAPAATAPATGRPKNGAAHHSDIQSLQEGAEIAGKIVLLRRGGCGFLAKVMWAQRRGAVAVIVGDDRKGGPLIQMYASGDTSDVLIPSVFTAHATAHLLTALVAAAIRDDDGKKKSAFAAHAPKPETTTSTTATPVPTAQKTAPDDTSFWRARPREWVLDEYVPTSTQIHPRARSTGRSDPDPADADNGRALYVTISPARGGFTLVDTILFIIASPFIAIMVITAVLVFLRAQCNYRAWRGAPKALVSQLPVHIFVPPGEQAPEPVAPASPASPATPLATPPRSPSPRSPSPSSPSTPSSPSNREATVTTPLLQQRPRSRTTTGVPGDERRVLATLPEPVPHQRSRYSQVECVVCLEDYVAGDRIMELPCGHEFHEACITPWLTSRRRTCPICKCDIVKAATGDAA